MMRERNIWQAARNEGLKLNVKSEVNEAIDERVKYVN